VSRGKDFREPRRRGFDDDDFSPRNRAFGSPPPYAASAPVDRAPAGPPRAATVKWFNPEKGFGFVGLTDGTGDAFLHVAVLERAGHGSALPPGATLQVRIGQGQKGPQVTEVIEVDASTATAAPPRSGGFSDRGPPKGRPSLDDAVQRVGTVKWYNADKGFGFVVVEGGGKDVFVHATALQRAGLTTLAEGQRVSMDVVEGRKGPEAAGIRLAD
jgi:CspA family cold shock protein